MKKAIIIFSALLFLAGLVVLLYPVFRTTAFQQAEKEAIRQFEQYRTAETEEEPKDNDTPADNGKAFPELWYACADYNEALKTKQQTSFTAQSWEQPPICLSDYDWEQDIFGYISIPSADIEAPLYLGGSMANLRGHPLRHRRPSDLERDPASVRRPGEGTARRYRLSDQPLADSNLPGGGG